MTEAEWLSCNDLIPMLIYLRGEVEPFDEEPDTRPRLLTCDGPLVFGDGKRVSKQRLGWFAYECCKKWWELPLDALSRHLVFRYETFLVSDGSWEEFESAFSRLWDAAATGAKPLITTMCDWSLTPFGMANLAEDLAWVTACYRHRERIEEFERTASEDDRFSWGFFGYDFPEFGATVSDVRRPFPTTLREVVGNPFRSIGVDPSWLVWNEGTVVKLAHSIYNERAFARMPILGDALLDAGCEQGDILDHCRQKLQHHRGCWLLDLLTGRIAAT
jgi:hypothetical protein